MHYPQELSASSHREGCRCCSSVKDPFFRPATADLNMVFIGAVHTQEFMIGVSLSVGSPQSMCPSSESSMCSASLETLTSYSTFKCKYLINKA